MNILVTGGAGFIGSHFVRHLVKTCPAHHIINVDVLTYAGNLENLKDIEHHRNYAFVHGNILDRSLIKETVDKHKVDVIVHFAAESHVDRSIRDASIFVKTNVLGTQVLLDVARECHVEKYVQISTDEVYGSLGKAGSFTEQSPLMPNSPYSASKASADLLVLAYHQTFGMNVNITRCSNNYGPYQFPEKLISSMITNALDGEILPVYGDGQHIRDWLHVQDHCMAVDRVIHDGKPGEIYNIGARNEWRNLNLVKTILDKMDKPHTLIHFVKDRPGHDQRYAIDSSKIMNELGWEPTIPFDRGIEDTITWYLTHQEWWRSLKMRQNDDDGDLFRRKNI